MLLREKARELARTLPYQTIKDSPGVKYYTDWTKFDPCIDPGELPKPTPSPELPSVKPHIALINGYLKVDAPSGIRIKSLSDDDLKYIDISESKAVARHVANLLGGAYVEVEDGSTGVLRIMNYTEHRDRVLIPGHYTVNIGDGVKALMEIHLYSPPNSAGCQSNTMEIHLGADSTLDLLTVSIQGNNPSFTLIRFVLGPGSSVRTRTLLVNGLMNHHREDYLMQGKGSSVDNLGLELGSGESRIDYIANLIHLGEYSNSYSRVLGVARDKSFVIHRGLGRIAESGKWSNTVVEGKVLIASENAVAASVPIIMVDTGDVGGARHSASDASIDEEQLLYLRMRGISEDEAMDLLVSEMINQFTEKLPEEFSQTMNVLRKWLLMRFAMRGALRAIGI